MIVWLNLRYYFQLDLVPVLNDKSEYVNNCTLVDTTEKKSIETIAFRSDVIIPILRNKDTTSFKKIGECLREVAAKHGIYAIKSESLPKGKKQQGKLVVKDRIKEMNNEK